MKDHFKLPEEIRAFDFYKADEDIRYLLKDRHQEINESERMVLYNVLVDLKEWFSSNYNKVAYKGNLNKLSRKIKLEIKLTIIDKLIFIVGKMPFENLNDFKGVETLKANLAKFKLPFVQLKKDQLSVLERAKGGATNDYNRLMGTFEDNFVEFNYVRECIKISKALGMSIDPMKITLMEWLEYIKLVEDVAATNK